MRDVKTVPALLLVKDILNDEGRFQNAYRVCLLQIQRNTKIWDETRKQLIIFQDGYMLQQIAVLFCCHTANPLDTQLSKHSFIHSQRGTRQLAKGPVR